MANLFSWRCSRDWTIR